MDELERVLAGNSAAAPPANILDGVDDTLAHREIGGMAGRAPERFTTSSGIFPSGCG